MKSKMMWKVSENLWWLCKGKEETKIKMEGKRRYLKRESFQKKGFLSMIEREAMTN